ncbi:hypothetical protein OD214_000650 [Salmonella enterica]|nr:hypothetical protein [Salmonella enterica]EJX3290935.1 hypothetical protein [Salmonella enterica]EJX3306861.1 hypothetical protein [Salmonella enterica]
MNGTETISISAPVNQQWVVSSSISGFISSRSFINNGADAALNSLLREERELINEGMNKPAAAKNNPIIGIISMRSISMFDLYVFVHETLPIFGFGFSCFGLGYILGYVRGCN